MTIRRKALSLLVLVAACGDDSGAGGNGVDPPPYMDGGSWICPSAIGQMFPCQCNDGTDNDGDGQVDLNDADCFDLSDNSEGTAALGNTQCTDGNDNDGDGATDSGDPECTGPLDDREDSFATGIPGDNSDTCKQDCWFDGDSGSGNDGCLWDLACDPVAGPAYECGAVPGGGRCDDPQSIRCVDFCSRFTPNGCDCFGCCDVYVDGTAHTILLNPQCTTEVISDASKCVPCTKVDSCNNPCDPCEYCLGREPTGTDCAPPDGGPGYECAAGEVTCDPVEGTCPEGFWCLTGCCVPNID
jgi:hypothetical protein